MHIIAKVNGIEDKQIHSWLMAWDWDEITADPRNASLAIRSTDGARMPVPQARQWEQSWLRV